MDIPNARYSATFYKTVARARDNVQDLTNVKQVRFHVGEDTGIFVYSADFNLALPGLELTGEFARSTRHSRYPAHMDRSPAFGASPRFSTKDDAYFLNATHWFDRGRVGAEAFSINPDFTTTYRTYLKKESFFHTNLLGMLNETIYWDLVEDNDDGDRLPDRRMGNIVGFINDSQDYDLDGVHLAQDEDNDGFPETNRDGDFVPDYEEPFLMYDVEPNIYFYGLDRNNNDEPDPREDDGQVDYPYDPDQRGFHLFAEYDLTHQLSLAAGHYSVNEIAGPGRNKSTWGYPFNRSASRPPSVFGRRPPRPVCPWAFQARGMPSPFGRLGGQLPRPSAGNEILETHRLVGHGQLEHAIKHHAAAAGAAAIEAEHELVEVVAHVGTVGGPLMRSQQPPLGQ